MTTGLNGYGEEVRTKGDVEIINVFGWYVTGGQERAPDGHVNQVEYDAVVLAKSGDLGVDDEVNVPGVGWCAVEGSPANYDNGPWWSPGLESVTLSRVSSNDSY